MVQLKKILPNNLCLEVNATSKKIVKRRPINISLGGLQIIIKGRIGGSRRTRTIRHTYGKQGPTSHCINSKSNQTTINTKWGTWNLRTTLLKNINQ